MAIVDRLTNMVSGKIGDKVYFTLNGEQLVRRKPAPRKTDPSLKELQTRSKFAFITKFLLPLKSLINLTFRSPGMTPMNRAISVNFKNADIGNYPDWQMNFNTLKLGYGEIAGAADLTMNHSPAGYLSFTWNVKSRRWYSQSSDEVWIAVYCEALQKWLTHAGTTYRKDGFFILDVSDFSGHSVHVFVGFISIFRGGSSDGQYVGEVEVTAKPRSLPRPPVPGHKEE